MQVDSEFSYRIDLFTFPRDGAAGVVTHAEAVHKSLEEPG